MSEQPQSSKVNRQKIDTEHAGQRLDNWLIGRLKGVPRSRIYRIIRDGQVRVNSRRVNQRYRLEVGDEVRIPPVRMAQQGVLPPVGDGLATHISQSLIYEDDWLLVYNKPAGLAVHGGSGISLGLIETLRQLRLEDRQLELIHRLDRDTSGCVMVARRRSFLRRMHKLMQEGGITKRYWLLCHGFKGTSRVIDAPLLRTMQGNERIVQVAAEGKASRTRFRLLQQWGEVALVEAVLETGRTHQIRVHAQYGGFPLLGDPKYGGSGAEMADFPGQRLYLHARSLTFRHPETEDEVCLEAPLDRLFDAALNKLGC